MAQFDVHRLRPEFDLVVDCQSDLFDHLPRRFVIPLLPERESDLQPLGRLTPVFEIDGDRVVLAPMLAGSVPVKELGSAVASLASERDRIIAAIDALIAGV